MWDNIFSLNKYKAGSIKSAMPITTRRQCEDLYGALIKEEWDKARQVLKSSSLHPYSVNDGTNIKTPVEKSQQKNYVHMDRFSDHNLLYAACTYSSSADVPMDIVESIYNLSPNQIYYVDGNKRTILHVSCYRSYDLVVKFLLTHHPDAVSIQDRYGKTPLHLALRYHSKNCSVKLVETLTEMHPEGVLTKDNKGFTPIYYFFQKWNYRLQKIREANDNNFSNLTKNYPSLTHSAANDDNGKIKSDRLQDQHQLHGQYHIDYEDYYNTREIFIILLKAIHYCEVRKTKPSIYPGSLASHPTNMEGSVLYIHTAMKYPSTPTIFLYLLLDLSSPSSYTQKDSMGNNLLHIAYARPPSTIVPFEYQSDNMERRILNQYPILAQEHNILGQYPLALLLRRQHHMDCIFGWKSHWRRIETLLSAAPNTLCIQIDLQSCLYPFMVAAVPPILESSKTNASATHTNETTRTNLLDKNSTSERIEIDKNAKDLNESTHERKKRKVRSDQNNDTSFTFILSTVYSLLRLDPSLVQSGIPMSRS